MGQVLRRAISKAKTAAETTAAEPPVAPPRYGPIGHSRLVDKERPLRLITPAKGRPPMLDDLNALEDIIRRDHARAAELGIERIKPKQIPPWVERGISVEEYAEEIRQSRWTGVAPAPPPQAERNPEAETPEWDRSHPNYKFMAEQLAKKIVSKPQFEVTPVSDPGPKPQNRGIARPKSQSIPGKLKLDELKQVFLLRYGQAEGEPKPLDVETIAKRFNVDAEMLKKVFRYTSLPTPVKDESEESKHATSARLRS